MSAFSACDGLPGPIGVLGRDEWVEDFRDDEKDVSEFGDVLRCCSCLCSSREHSVHRSRPILIYLPQPHAVTRTFMTDAADMMKIVEGFSLSLDEAKLIRPFSNQIRDETQSGSRCVVFGCWNFGATLEKFL